MPKTTLSASQQFDLRHALQVATLEALLASRRWQPGELIFQGGTSLHLVHGSPRFSEDLDFLVHASLDLSSIGTSIHARLVGTPWLPKGTRLEVTKAKDDHNPHTFVVVVGGPTVIGAVRVRVEFWQTSEASMAPLQVSVTPVRLANGPAAGAQAFVPTADLHEIFVDKVFAVGARPYLKPRDLFDLHWILARQPGLSVTREQLQLRLATYPNETPAHWLKKAGERVQSLPAAARQVGADLRRWLPSNWPMDDAAAADMIAVSVAALQQGIAEMTLLAETNGDAPGDPVAGDRGEAAECLTRHANHPSLPPACSVPATHALGVRPPEPAAPLFRGADLTVRFQWDSKTASHYLWLWKQRGLVEPLGGHSDVFANLVVARQPNWEAALLLARPSAVLTGIECLRRAGWTTQIPARPEVAINGSLPLISSGRFDVQRRSDAWFASVQPGIHRDPRADHAADPSERFAPALRPAWALADMLQRDGWAGCGLQPDDIDLDRLKDADRRDLARATQAWAAAGGVAADLTNLVTSSRLVTLPGSTN